MPPWCTNTTTHLHIIRSIWQKPRNYSRPLALTHSLSCRPYTDTHTCYVMYSSRYFFSALCLLRPRWQPSQQYAHNTPNNLHTKLCHHHHNRHCVGLKIAHTRTRSRVWPINATGRPVLLAQCVCMSVCVPLYLKINRMALKRVPNGVRIRRLHNCSQRTHIHTPAR